MSQLTSRASSSLIDPRRDRRAGSSIKLLVLGILVLLLFIADAWVTFHSIVELKGQSFDFYFIWAGAREVGGGRDPYTPEIARQIQLAVSNNNVELSERPFHFTYPAFLAFLVWPFVSFSFPESVTGWLVSQQVCLVLALLFALYALKWKPRPVGVLALVLAWVAFRYTLIALLLGQTTMLVLLFVCAACYASQRQHDGSAGILFAMAMIKPQLVLLTILGWLVVKLSERRWIGIETYGAGVLALTLAPLALVSNWIPAFGQALFLYPIYRPSGSSLSALASAAPDFAAVVQVIGGALCVAYLLWVARRNRNVMETVSLGILSTILLIPLVSTYDISLTLLPWLACLRVLIARRDIVSRALVVVLCSLPIVSWLVTTVFPAMLETWGLPFDVEIADKLIIPLTLFLIFVYTERKQMWNIAV